MPLDGVQLGRYRLLRTLGSGGMGEVYLAEDLHIHRQVAIKVVSTESSPYPNNNSIGESERLFRREIRAIASLDHPHILPLFDYGEETVHDMLYTYMVMPLRSEGSLTTWLRQRTASSLLSVSEVLHFIRQAARALAYAHRRQIVHQDVKPSNFLIRADEEHLDLPDIMLADFGIAKFYTATSSVSQTSRGTPSYMAPEQWTGQPVAASDQYALGIMAYQLLTGELPFKGRQEQVMYLHFNAPPQPPSKLNLRIPAAIDAVILRALAKKPEERFPSVSAFAQAFQQAVPGTERPAIQRVTSSPLPASPNTSGELRATLAISNAEAAQGTTRTLTLPGGRRVPVSIPARVVDGHTIRLEQATPDGAAVLVTIAIRRPDDEISSLARPQGQEALTVRNPRAVIHASLSPSLRRFKQLSKGAQAALIAASVLLIFLLFVGAPFYFTRYNYGQRMGLLNVGITNPYGSGGTLALNDPLKDNSNGYYWYEGSTITGTCAFTQGSYHISATQSGSPSACTADPNFSNFAFEVQMTILQGDSGGIIFCFDAAGSTYHYYFFRIAQDGSYTLKLYTDASGAQDLPNGSSTVPAPAIHTGIGQTNLVAAVVTGGNMILSVNNQQVATVNESTYSQGQVGFAAEDDGNATEVAFQNARVWTF